MSTTPDSKENHYLVDFERLEKSLNGEAAGEIHRVRKAAMARFSETGFPTTRDEEWKYTDVSPIARIPFKTILKHDLKGIGRKDLTRFAFKGLKCTQLVFVNGHCSPELSSKSSGRNGVVSESLLDGIANGRKIITDHLLQYAGYEVNAFTALNAAFLRDGAVVHIPDGVVLKEPIHLLFLSTSTDIDFVSYPRNLIIAGRNSEATVIESYVGLGGNRYFTNAVTEIFLGENAVLGHEKIQGESKTSFHIGTVQVRQARNSNLFSNSMSFGGALVRNNLTSVLDGDGAECTMNGLYVASGDQHVDNHTAIDHAKPNCSSHELYKGILAEKSKGVFNGKIIVQKDAQKTDAKQTNKNLILSENASVDTKPQLEIFANDVKCTHGATIGQLDDDAIFYLRSRGIGVNKAREILIYAFVSDVIDRIKLEPVRDSLRKMVRSHLQKVGNLLGAEK